MDQALRVLMVEDSEDDAHLMLRQLERAGYQVTCTRVTTAPELQQALQQGPWHIALVDYQLPQFSAPAALALLARHAADIPAIVVSGAVGEESAVECMRAGARDYVMKDNLTRLAPAVARELAEAQGRRQSARALAESQVRYQTLVETMRDGLTTVDTAGRLTYCNEAFARLLGYSRDELVGRPITDLCDETNRDILRAQLERRIVHGETAEYELEYLAADGHNVPVWVSASPLRDPDGRIVGGFAVIRDLTERKAAERALRSSEARYRNLVETMADGVIQADPNGIINFANGALLEMIGVAAEAFLGTSIFDHVHPEDHEELRRQVAARRRGERSRYEVRLVTPAGRQIDVHVSASPMYEADGSFSGTLAVITDISELRASQRALQESEANLATILRTAPLGIGLLRNRVFCWVNERMRDLVGYAPEELIGKSARILYPNDEEFERVGEVKYSQIRNTGVGAIDTVFRRRNGQLLDVHLRSAAIDPDDLSAGVIFTAQDITWQKSADKTLRELTEFQRSVIDSGVMWICVLDPAGTVVLWNRAAEEISGYTHAEMTRQPGLLEALAPDTRTLRRMRLALARVLQEDAVIRGLELPIRTKSGEQRMISWHARRLPGPDGQPSRTLIVGHDVTEFRNLQRQLLQAQKMEAVGQLAGGIAHDFNNMLTAILGNAELAMLYPDDRQRLEASLRDIQHAGRQAAALIRQLLAFSRRQHLQPKIVDLNRIIRELQPMFRRLIEENITLVLDLDEDLRLVEVDPVQMEQVILNLVVNARDAMPEGGTLTVRTRNVVLSESFTARHPDATVGPAVELSVRDTGIGMDEETRARVFEPFFTTKRDGKGTGLGLSTVYGIVRQSGGSVHVTSAPGEGSVFTIYLPASGAQVPTEGAKAQVSAGAGGTETVLVAEDEDLVRRLAVSALRMHGYNVLEAYDGGAALKLAAEYDGPIDLLVTDVVMPGMNGPELADRVQALRPDIRVLYVSGYADSHLVRDRIDAQGRMLVGKPFSPDQLLAAVRGNLDAPPPGASG